MEAAESLLAAAWAWAASPRLSSWAEDQARPMREARSRSLLLLERRPTGTTTCSLLTNWGSAAAALLLVWLLEGSQSSLSCLCLFVQHPALDQGHVCHVSQTNAKAKERSRALWNSPCSRRLLYLPPSLTSKPCSLVLKCWLTGWWTHSHCPRHLVNTVLKAAKAWR